MPPLSDNLLSPNGLRVHADLPVFAVTVTGCRQRAASRDGARDNAVRVLAAIDAGTYYAQLDAIKAQAATAAASRREFLLAPYSQEMTK